MYQTSIQFFWPLTEQIPLDLDYTDCERPKLIYSNTAISGDTGMAFVTNVGLPVWTTSINVDSNNITVTSKNVPPLYRRILFKLLGIKWEKA